MGKGERKKVWTISLSSIFLGNGGVHNVAENAAGGKRGL